MSATRWRGSPSSSTSSSASGASAERAVRRRRRAALAVALLVAAGAIAWPLLAREGGPPDRLVRLAPPGTLVWAHASLRPGDGAGWALATRFPALRDLPARLAGAFGLQASRLDVARDVRPWTGEEAGLAALGPGPPLLLLSVTDRRAAADALVRLGATRAGSLYRMPAPGVVAGLGEEVLAAGPEDAVRAALARARDGSHGLDATPEYARATAGRDGDRLVDAYVPAAGVRALLGARSPLVRAAATLLAGPAVQAVGAEVMPAERGARVRARVVRADGGTPPATFAPALLGRVPERGTVALVDVPGAPALLALAQRLGAGALVKGARAAVARAGLDLDAGVLGALRGETALSLASHGVVPVFTLLARSADPPATREALARLQAPLAARLTGGAAGAFEARNDGAFTLPATPALQPSYALSGNVLVASTAQPGLEQRRVAARGIAQSPAFGKALERAGSGVQALVFLDLHQLLLLGERTGLAAGSGFQTVRADLDPVRAVGAVVRQEPDHPTDTTAELFLQIP